MAKDILPIGIQDFPKLRSFGATYVDKTNYIRRMIENGTIYFLSRPRRFGKSLFLSTLQSFFEGRKELFAGLDIYDWTEWDWTEYPVFRIDLNAKNYNYQQSLAERISSQLEDYEKLYEIEPSSDSSLDGRFISVIRQACLRTGRSVVVLIDEYDKPILDTIDNDMVKDLHRDTLRAFYSAIKSCDQYIRFCFITGITKFGQLNIFSGLNNLKDVSLWNEYAGICGITEEELHHYFHSGVSACAHEWNCSDDEAYLKLKQNYDGYHFSPSLVDIYNPWSVLNAIESRQINMYWNMTGGGSYFLYRLLDSGKMQLSNLDNIKVGLEDIKGTSMEPGDAIPMLYQSGYLTIKSYDAERLSVTLKYPNYEVERGFLRSLLPAYSGIDKNEATFAIDNFVDDVRQGNVAAFIGRMQTFFEDFPYENSIKNEKQFQNIMYCIMRMMGLQTQVERHSSRGSADMVLQTKDYIYVMEFKIGKSPQEALRQIDSKGYSLPFRHDPRQLIKVGIEFSLETRNIASWRME